MNEGWATFWHYTIVHQLYDEELVDDQFMIEFLHNHTNVIYQPSYDNPFCTGLNPYTLGFCIFSDLRRICEAPTEEDHQWFPDLVNTNWMETLDFAMRNFKDESFISQFLSPKVIRDLKLFILLDDDQQEDLKVTAIHNDEGYQQIREMLCEQYSLSNNEPDIQVYNVDVKGDRSLTLRYTQRNRRPLAEHFEEVLKHVHTLWGFGVKLEMVNEEGEAQSLAQCPAHKKPI
jgi:stage V sporulation protein R